MIAHLLWDSLWQGAVICSIAYVATRLMSDRNATTRYAIWLAALLAMIVVPLATQFSNFGTTLVQWLFAGTNRGGSVAISLTAVDGLSNGVAATPSLLVWIEAAWVAGVGVQTVRLLVSLARVMTLRRQATPMPEFGEDVVAFEGVPIPIAAGFIRPRVILPRTLVTTLSRSGVEAIIAHERAHIRRGDIYGNLAQRAIETALWFNPFVHVVGHHLVRERESACDDWAVRDKEAADYAACLAELATRSIRSAPLLTPSALGSDSTLLNRVRRLMRGGPVRLSLNYFTLGGIVVTFAILTLAIQALNPVTSSAATASTGPQHGPALVAAACSTPDQLASVVRPVPPDYPASARGVKGAVVVAVTLDAGGKITSATIRKSSGNDAIDQATLAAAKKSTYAAAERNCVPVAGTYLYKAQFKP